MTLRDAAGHAKTLTKGSYRLQPGGTSGHLQLVNKATGAITKALVAPVQINPRSQPLRLDDSAGIGFAGDHWHGSFRVIESGSSLLCVDVVGLEKYLRGVVPSEMPASWPLPALKSQAVAARSYAVATKNPSGSFDAYADTRSQVYGPIEHESPASSAAVAATAHRVVYYKGTRCDHVLLVELGRAHVLRAGGVGHDVRPALPRAGDPTATTARAAPTRTTRGRHRRSRPPASRTRSGSPGRSRRSPRPSTRPRSGC